MVKIIGEMPESTYQRLENLVRRVGAENVKQVVAEALLLYETLVEESHSNPSGEILHGSASTYFARISFANGAFAEFIEKLRKETAGEGKEKYGVNISLSPDVLYEKQILLDAEGKLSPKK